MRCRGNNVPRLEGVASPPFGCTLEGAAPERKVYEMAQKRWWPPVVLMKWACPAHRMIAQPRPGAAITAGVSGLLLVAGERLNGIHLQTYPWPGRGQWMVTRSRWG